MFGFDEYIYGLIDEAKSPEEIKKILEYQFVKGKGVPEDVLDYIFAADPTKKKTYTRWTLMQWEKSKDSIMQAVRSGNIRKLFKTFKERESDASGLNLVSMPSFEAAMEYIPDVDPILKKEGDPNAPENQFDIMFETDEWVVALPHTYEADKKLGEGCRWCTAGYYGNGEGYYKKYSSAGPLWINFDMRSSEIAPGNHKEYPYKRYQFLFEWQDWHGELNNSNNDRVDFEDVDIPYDVIEFYREQNEKYAEIIENGPENNMSYEEYMDNRDYLSTTIIAYDSMQQYLILMPEQNDAYQLENVPWLLYDEEDPSDPVFPNYDFDADNIFVERFDQNGECQLAVIRSTSGKVLLVYYNSNDRYGNWELSEDFGNFDCGEIKFFVDYYNAYVLIVNKNSGKSFVCYNEYDSGKEIFANEEDAREITDIIPNNDINSFVRKNQIYGYEGMFFEIVYNEGKHGLLYLSHDWNDIELIIKKDKPYGNTGQFEPYLEGDTLCVKGENWSYNLGDTSSNYNIVEEFSEYNDNLCGVKSNNGYNIYDKRNGRCIFDEDCENITYFFAQYICYALVRIKSGSENRFIYDITNEKKIPIESDRFTRAGYGGDTWMAYYNGGEYIISLAGTHPLIHGPYKECNFLQKTYFLVVTKDGKRNIIDSNTGKMSFPKDTDECVLDNNLVGKWAHVNINGKHAIFNFCNGKMVLDGVGEFCRPKIIARIDDGIVWVAKMKDEKFVLMYEDTNLLGTSFDTLYDYIGNGNVVIGDNKKIYVISLKDGVKILPTKDGIDTRKARPVSITTNEMAFNIGDYRVVYSPLMKNPQESISIIRDYTTKDVPDDVRSEIFGIFYPSIARVQNSFNDTLNKMTVTERRNRYEKIN